MKLRKGVKFHDGTPFNAQAAKWNLDKGVESKSPTLSDLKSMDVIDDCNASYVKDAGWFYSKGIRPNLKYAWLDK